MHERLREMARQLVVRKGEEGMEVLRRVAGEKNKPKSRDTILRYINGKTAPSDHVAYKIALACGCSDSQALALASQGPTDTAKESA